jgi:nitric oxide reductase activation protein
MSMLLRPQRYQRVGRLDQKQLVNAVARDRSTVFVRSKLSNQLDLAVSINVDISGSMDQFNRSIDLDNLDIDHTEDTAQLVDAITICAIGLKSIEVDFEVRAFGGYQWLAKTYYESDCFGIAGLAKEDRKGTDMAPAIRYSRIALLGRLEKDQLLIMMTDGYPVNPVETAEEVRLAKQVGIHVLGILFANNAEERSLTDPSMAQLFGPNGFEVIHSLDEFPKEVGQAIKRIILRKTIHN